MRAAITPEVKAVTAGDKSARVVIRADKAVKWAFMKTVMQAVANAGVENVTFSVVNRDKNAPAP